MERRMKAHRDCPVAGWVLGVGSPKVPPLPGPSPHWLPHTVMSLGQVCAAGSLQEPGAWGPPAWTDRLTPEEAASCLVSGPGKSQWSDAAPVAQR